MASKNVTLLKIIPPIRFDGWDFLVNLRCLFIISVVLFWTNYSAQVNPIQVGSLASLINEASGLQCLNPDLCYTFNDSDDNSRLYRIDGNGQFISQLVIEGVPQIDYEDIAYASDGRLFIGDFGNNTNDRQDLRIHILTDFSGSVSVPSTIEFEYEDQTSFPPSASELNFDVEAMIHWQDSLFLFTRNRTSPYNGLTKVYSLSDEAGSQTAQLRGEVFGNLSEIHNSITAADISPSGNRIVWLTRGSIFLFSGPSSNLSNEIPTYNFFSISRSYEGVSFIDDCNILLVEEGESAGIYALNTCDILTGLEVQFDENEIQIYEHGGTLFIESELGVGSVQIIDYLGRAIITQDAKPSIDISHLSTGTYIASVKIGNNSYSHRFQVTGF